MKKIEIKFAQPTIKLAMPVQMTPETKEKMKGSNWFFAPEVSTTPQDLSIVRKLKEQGIESEITLPKIYKYKPKNARNINGQPYLIFEIEEPYLYSSLGRVPKNKKNLVSITSEGKFSYPGKIRAININTGNVEVFTYQEAFDSIKTQSIQFSEKTRLEINKAVNRYNEKISKIDAAAADLTRLPLQLSSAKNIVDERIQTLDEMINALNQEINSNKPSGISEYEQEIEEKINSGQLGERDFKEYALAKYPYHYDQLVKDLKDGKLIIPNNIPNPEEYKQKLISMGQIAFDKYMEERSKRLQEDDEEEEIKEPFDISQQEIKDLKELAEGEVPVSLKTKGYPSYEGYIKTQFAALKGCERDKKELSKMSSMLDGIANEIGRLGAGQRSIEYLKTQEGQKIVGYLKTLCNEGLKRFTERYSRKIVDEQGRIDPSKFGREGSMGNALLIVVFTRIYTVISELFKKAGLPNPIVPTPSISIEQTKDPTSLPQKQNPSPVQANSIKTIKIAQSSDPLKNEIEEHEENNIINNEEETDPNYLIEDLHKAIFDLLNNNVIGHNITAEKLSNLTGLSEERCQEIIDLSKTKHAIY
jgi:predicted transcriptional regulator